MYSEVCVSVVTYGKSHISHEAFLTTELPRMETGGEDSSWPIKSIFYKGNSCIRAQKLFLLALDVDIEPVFCHLDSVCRRGCAPSLSICGRFTVTCVQKEVPHDYFKSCKIGEESDMGRMSL